jgi:hypothetical protein
MLKIRIIAGVISFLLLVVILELIRRRKFMEKYALLWLFSGSLIFIFCIFPEPLFILARIMGIYYLTVLLLFSFIFLLSIILYTSIALSRLTEDNKELAQEIGILKLRVKSLEKEHKSAE